MNKKVIGLLLSCLVVTALILASCSKTTTTTTTTTTNPTSTTTTTKTTTTTTTAPPTSTTSTTAVTGNWWDSNPQPQYGGQMVTRINNNFANWDPGLGADSSISFGYFEQLFGDDWTVNPADYTFQLNFRPNNYVEGYLAQSWEFTGPSTFVVELRHGILW
jgi:guanyl-specific ribonuclease Sa